MKKLIEKVRKLMGRPSTIKPLDGGEVILKGCTKETIEAVRTLLTAKPDMTPAKVVEATVTPPVVAKVAAPVVADEAMPSPAIGIYQNPLTLNWHICDIRFSPYTKKAIVYADKPLGRDKYECDEHFKIRAVGMGLIG